MTPVVKMEFPTGTTVADLDFGALSEAMVGDDVFVGAGTYTAAELAAVMATQDALADALDILSAFGELAEKPGKLESKLNKLKTRNFIVPGKRTNAAEISLVGLGQKQKAYLESTAFSSTETTVILVNTERDRAVVLNGMRWTVEWSGEVDGLFTVVLSTEFSGSTSERIFLYKDIPVVSGT